MSIQDIPRERFLDIVSFLPDADRQSLRIACVGFRKLIPYLPIPIIHSPGHEHAPREWIVNPSMQVFDRRDFQQRLLRDGNVFAGQDVKACGGCLHIRPAAAFIQSLVDLKIDDQDVCKECILELLDYYINNGHYLFCAFCPRTGVMKYHNSNSADASGPPAWNEMDTRGLCGNCMAAAVGDATWGGHKLGLGAKDFHRCFCGDITDQEELHGPCDASPEDIPHPIMRDCVRICEDCHREIRGCKDPECSGWPASYIENNREWFHGSDSDGKEETKGFK